MNKRIISSDVKKQLIKAAEEIIAEEKSEVIVKILPNNYRHLGDDAGYIECTYKGDTSAISDDVNQIGRLLDPVLGKGEWAIEYSGSKKSIKITVFDEAKTKKAKTTVVGLLKKHYKVSE